MLSSTLDFDLLVAICPPLSPSSVDKLQVVSGKTNAGLSFPHLPCPPMSVYTWARYYLEIRSQCSRRSTSPIPTERRRQRSLQGPPRFRCTLKCSAAYH